MWRHALEVFISIFIFISDFPLRLIHCLQDIVLHFAPTSNVLTRRNNVTRAWVQPVRFDKFSETWKWRWIYKAYKKCSLKCFPDVLQWSMKPLATVPGLSLPPGKKLQLFMGFLGLFSQGEVSKIAWGNQEKFGTPRLHTSLMPWYNSKTSPSNFVHLQVHWKPSYFLHPPSSSHLWSSIFNFLSSSTWITLLHKIKMFSHVVCFADVVL